jgi:hypothetical protein
MSEQPKTGEVSKDASPEPPQHVETKPVVIGVPPATIGAKGN